MEIELLVTNAISFITGFAIAIFGILHTKKE